MKEGQLFSLVFILASLTIGGGLALWHQRPLADNKANVALIVTLCLFGATISLLNIFGS